MTPGKRELLTFDSGVYSKKERYQGLVRWVIRDSAGSILAADTRAIIAWQEAYAEFQRRRGK